MLCSTQRRRVACRACSVVLCWCSPTSCSVVLHHACRRRRVILLQWRTLPQSTSSRRHVFLQCSYPGIWLEVHSSTAHNPNAPCFVHRPLAAAGVVHFNQSHNDLVLPPCLPHSPFERTAISHPATGHHPLAPCLLQYPELLTAAVGHLIAVQTPYAPWVMHSKPFLERDLQPGMQHGSVCWLRS